VTSQERVDHLRGTARAAHERRLRERAELMEDLRAVADALVCLVPPDMLRAKVGRESVLRIYKLAGRDPAALADSWSEDDRKVQRQSTVRTGDDWADSVRHEVACCE